ncbi:RimK-like ATP-grasp domain-containing protein [Nitrosomonas nitrosa]|uniref:RimK-like ATP-grasp domain-containing protein n=1 Tax=Nitrosomonas nitrosa TaxID=52442 RepID=A0A8H8YZS0_9PROT|nr:hypothetical protein [Nitrosomonas nitrosa]CAE6502054.1 RimK-like ATP-grasp domain-containing protein [Nitrosomonas nitrosa]
MNKPIIAIQKDHQLLTSGRYQSFSARWHELAAQQGITTRAIDIFSNATDGVVQLQDCDAFMYWFAQPPSVSRPARKLIASLAHVSKIRVFPNLNTIWHFDDKIAEFYLLRLAGIPIPKTTVLWSRDQAVEFITTATSYPLVLKLTSGIISRNVELVHNAKAAHRCVQELFGSGMHTLPPPNFPFRWYLKRILEASRILLCRERDEEFHKGYLLFQEFLPGNDFDIRITIIGNRAFAFRRHNRPNDFRASGSGRIDWDPTQIPLDALMLAFKTAKTLKTQSLAVDILRRNGEPVIVEISYYYEGWAVAACPGHWQLQNHFPQPIWVEGSMRPEDAIWSDFIACLDIQ